MEINIISFIVLIYQRFRLKGVESCLKYFFIQRIGSVILISVLYYNRRIVRIYLAIILRYKLGAGMFFFWFPSVCMGLRWFSCYLLITFQKVIPLILIGLLKSKIVWLVVIMRLLFGILGRFNQIDIKQLMAFSSIHHLGWMILCIMNDDYYFIIYLLIYRFVLLGIVYFVIDNEITSLLELGKIKGKWWFLIGILSIGGIPPLLGFFLKWIAFIYISKIGILWFMLLVISSVIIFYVYIRLLYDVIMGFNKVESWTNVTLLYKNRYDFVNIIRLSFIFSLGFFLLW